MPRNAQGFYTLPAGNPVIPGTIIESQWANGTMTDIADALTGSLPRDGSAPMTGPLTLNGQTPTNARHAVDKAYVDGFMAFATGFPVGFIAPYGGGAAPAGWLKCDGSAVSRATYSVLFTAIGVTYGSGDGSTTFNLPDLRSEFIRGRPDSRAVGSKQAASFAAHTHVVADPGHAHAQSAHTHGLNAHTHGVNDPGHSHSETAMYAAEDSDGSGVTDYYPTTGTTGVSVTGISIQAASDFGMSAAQPGIDSATTGVTISAAGGTETVPQNMALDYYIKAVNDSTGAPVLTEVDTSDANMIAITDVSPTVVRLDIQSNKPFGIPKLDGSGKVPVSLLPITNNDFLGFFDASSGQNPSEKYPANTYYSGDEYVISDAGTILVYDPITFVASMTAVSVGSKLVYVDGSVTNPNGWYYFVAAGATLASDVSYLPDGGVTATNVQAAITELGNTKVSKAGDTMTGPTVVSVNSTSTALRVTQTGTGDVVRFEDAANPDPTPTIIDQHGNVRIGTGSTPPGGTNRFDVVGDGTAANGCFSRFQVGDAFPQLFLRKGEGTITVPTPVLNGQTLGAVFFQGFNGTNAQIGAGIRGIADGTISASAMPGALALFTTPAGSNTPTERLRINNAGAFGLSGANFGSSGQTLISQGSGAPPIWANPQAGRTITANDANPGLLITQTGAGNALLVEDSANPDSTPFVIDQSGYVVSGATAPIFTASGFAKIQGVGLMPFSGVNNIADNTPAIIELSKIRGTAIVQANDDVGQIRFSSYDGTAYRRNASIGAQAEGVQAANDTAGRLMFSTTPTGSTSPVERLRIDNQGRVLIGVTTPGGCGLRVANNLTGQANLFGVSSEGTAQADGTGAIRYFHSQAKLVESAFTTGTLTHYNAATSAWTLPSVTNQFGFFANSSLVGATNNYGFYGNIPAGTGRWNFYAAGTAENYFAGKTYLGSPTGGGSIFNASTNGLMMFGKNLCIDTQNAQIGGNSAVNIRFQGNNAGGNPAAVTYQPYENGAMYEVFRDVAGVALGYIIDNGAGGISYTSVSDYRLKDSPVPLTGSGEFIDALQPRAWSWKANGKPGAGFIAHELQEVCPAAVSGEKDAVDAEGRPQMQGIDCSSPEMIAMLVAELQSLRKRVAELEAK